MINRVRINPEHIWKNETVMLKISCDGKFVAFTTYDRKHGRNGRFLMFVADIIEWGYVGTKYDMDCGNHIKLCCYDKKNVKISFDWISHLGDDDFYGFSQYVSIPKDIFGDAVLNCASRTFLYKPEEGSAKVDAKCAFYTLVEIKYCKLTKRAFSKAMRDSFKWKGDEIKLYSDGNAHDFCFYTKGKHGINGGLILHHKFIKGSDGKEYLKLYYEIHT